MGVFQFFIIVLIIGVIVWLLRRPAVPIDPLFKDILLWAGVAICVLFLLYALGVLPVGHDVMIPRIR